MQCCGSKWQKADGFLQTFQDIEWTGKEENCNEMEYGEKNARMGLCFSAFPNPSTACGLSLLTFCLHHRIPRWFNKVHFNVGETLSLGSETCRSLGVGVCTFLGGFPGGGGVPKCPQLCKNPKRTETYKSCRCHHHSCVQTITFTYSTARCKKVKQSSMPYNGNWPFHRHPINMTGNGDTPGSRGNTVSCGCNTAVPQGM